MIGILNAYHIDPSESTYQLEYGEICLKYFKRLFPNEDFKFFKVAQGDFPQSAQECDAWVITGSPASAYDNEEWIHTLADFIKECNVDKAKLLGICFGHQIIAQALGGKVQKSSKGWGVGIREFNIIEQPIWATRELSVSSLLFSHQDQVETLPEQARLIGTDSFCPVQIYIIGSHILSIQGHPEFTKEFAKARYDSRVERIGEEVYERAVDSLNGNYSSELSDWIIDFIS